MMSQTLEVTRWWEAPDYDVSWFEERGFIRDTGGWANGWSSSNGFAQLRFYPAGTIPRCVDKWCAIVENGVPGSNGYRGINLGTCADFLHMEAIWQALRRLAVGGEVCQHPGCPAPATGRAADWCAIEAQSLCAEHEAALNPGAEYGFACPDCGCKLSVN